MTIYRPHIRVLLIGFFTTILILSCSTLTGVKNLGDGYYLDEKFIILSLNSNNYNGTGTIVVPPDVISYRYNDNWIIAKTINLQRSKEFWIINKTKEKTLISQSYNDSIYWGVLSKYTNVEGPLDSTEFVEKIILNRIGLELKEN